MWCEWSGAGAYVVRGGAAREVKPVWYEWTGVEACSRVRFCVVWYGVVRVCNAKWYVGWFGGVWSIVFAVSGAELYGGVWQDVV